MPHIHTEPGQHDLTVSAYIVRMDLPEPAIILHKHRKLNKWLQFGGHVEPHENPWQAVQREIREESGYELSQLKLLQPNFKRPELHGAISHPWPVSINTHKFGDLDHYHTDIAYALTTAEDPTGTVTNDESQAFRTFTHTELLALGPDEIPEDVRGIALVILNDYIKTWQQVPVSV